MARKKIEPVETLGKDVNKLTVQKSLPLFALWRSDLTLSEFKILDTYLSRINSHEPHRRTVVFEKGELEEKLGVTKINKQDLEKRLVHLMGNVVKIPDNSSKRGFKLVTLFEEVEAVQDENTDLWMIKLECTQKAMKYFFNIENLGYLRYKLRCITNLTSRYTYIMFVYLESNRYRKEWEVDLEELKQILNCDQEEYVKEFKYFNRDILKKIQKELLEKTECKYIYKPITKSRKVVAIKFTLETLSDIEVIDLEEKEKREWEQVEQYESLSEREKWILDYRQICENIFTEIEMEEFIGLTNNLPLGSMYPNAIVNDIHFWRHHYISEKFRAFKTANNRKKIKNPYAYFKVMIEKDIQKFNNQD